MSTWHQDRNVVPLWHPVQWTLVVDPHNQQRTVQRFDTEAEAITAMRRVRYSYVLPPAPLP